MVIPLVFLIMGLGLFTGLGCRGMVILKLSLEGELKQLGQSQCEEEG